MTFSRIRTFFLFQLVVFFSFTNPNAAKAQLQLFGTAVNLGGSCYRLTQAVNTQAGAAYSANTINLNNSFNLKFTVNLGASDGGADGMCFMLRNTTSPPIGQGGGGITFETLSNSLGIEIDTWQNGNYLDPVYDHIAIVSNGNLDHALATNLAGPVQAHPTLPNIENNNSYSFIVDWDAPTQTIKVYFNCVLRLTYTGNIVANLFNNNPNVYWGFGASTGGANNQQGFCQISGAPVSALAFSDTTVCAGTPVSLYAGTSTATYSWSPSTYLNSSTSASPTSTPQANTTYYVNIIQNCDTVKDTVTVNVHPVVPFSLGPDTGFCQGGSLSLNATTGGYNTYTWIGTGITGPQITVTNPGTLICTAIDTNGCSRSDNIAITLLGLANSNFTLPPAICIEDPLLVLTADIAGGVFSGTGVVGNSFDPAIAGVGTHTITYTNNIPPCPGSTSKDITVLAMPGINMAILNPYLGPWCEGMDTTNFLNLPTPYPQGPGVFSQWRDGANANLTDTSSLGNTFVNFNVGNLFPGAHTLVYNVTVTTQGVGCSSSDSVDIIIFPRPIAPEVTTAGPYCSGEFVDNLQAIPDSAIYGINWYRDSIGVLLGTGPNYNYGTATTFGGTKAIFKLWVTEYIDLPNGRCESAATPFVFEVYETPVANFTVDSMEGKEPLPVSTTNFSSPVDMQTWDWTFSNGFTSSELEPSTVFESYGDYLIKLVVTNPIGCQDSMVVAIKVIVSFEFTYPEVFSPNGDGINDIFDVVVLGTQSFEGQIRDRWGKIVHTWSSNDNQWNGKRNNAGETLNDGVYFWTLNGVKAGTLEQFDHAGTITLLKGK